MKLGSLFSGSGGFELAGVLSRIAEGGGNMSIPDAPWIREAEMYGMPPYDDEPDPVCPICGKECETIYTDKDGDAFGCDQCVTLWEAYEWHEEHDV